MDALRILALAMYDWGCLVADKIDTRHLPPAIAYPMFNNWQGKVYAAKAARR